tara:strand:+ start:127 stop:537 length:411 start_codon:yes stop_codon:yes gene_type:complete
MQDEFNFKTHWTQLNIKEDMSKDKYPYKAGHRGHRNSIVSANHTNKILSRTKKQILIELYKHPKGLTGSELSDLTGITILTIRPRTSELKLLNLIIDTEKNKNNDGGKPESIYKLRSEILLKEFNIDVSEYKSNQK